MKKKKNIAFWEDVINEPPEAYKKWFETEEKFLNKNISPNALVLDVGCGNGRSLLSIIKKSQNLFGIDHEDKAIKDAKHNLKNYLKVKLILADATKLPFNDKFFDVVICMGTFANFGDKKIKALGEMRRVVKKKGFIIISVYSEKAFEARMNLYKKQAVQIKEINGTTVTFDEDTLSDNTSEQFSENQLRELFAESGLEVVEMKKLDIAYICKLRIKNKIMGEKQDEPKKI